MAGALVPAAGDLGEDTNTPAAQEQLFEDLAEAVRRILGVGVSSLSSIAISAGSVTPSGGLVVVDTEGAVGADNLDNVSSTNYLPGSLILVIGTNPARIVTIRHNQTGDGEFDLQGGIDFDLDDSRKGILLRLTNGLVWREVQRFWGGDFAGQRNFMGLGTAALLDDGDVDAATLEGLAAAAFLPVAGTAANAALLDSLDSTSFARVDTASLQTFLGGLRTDGAVVRVNQTSAAGASQVELKIEDVLRGIIYVDGVNDEMQIRLYEDDGATVAGAFRVRDGEVPDYWDKVGTQWLSIVNDLSPPFPNLGRVRWDKTGGTTDYSTIGEYTVHSADMPDLPGSGATKVLRVKAAITAVGVGTGGGSTPRFTARIYVGPTGDTTDTLVAEGTNAQDDSTSSNPEIVSEIDRDVVVSDDDFITLGINLIRNDLTRVQPSDAPTTTSEGLKTYFRVEQVG